VRSFQFTAHLWGAIAPSLADPVRLRTPDRSGRQDSRRSPRGTSGSECARFLAACGEIVQQREQRDRPPVRGRRDTHRAHTRWDPRFAGAEQRHVSSAMCALDVLRRPSTPVPTTGTRCSRTPAAGMSYSGAPALVGSPARLADLLASCWSAPSSSSIRTRNTASPVKYTAPVAHRSAKRGSASRRALRSPSRCRTIGVCRLVQHPCRWIRRRHHPPRSLHGSARSARAAARGRCPPRS